MKNSSLSRRFGDAVIEYERSGTKAQAELYDKLSKEVDELEAYLMDTLNQLDDCRLGMVDCLKSRSYEIRRLQEIIEMAWKGYGYDHEWDCDCPVCATIRTRTPYGTTETKKESD